MNSVPEKESLLKQTAAAPPFLVRFSVLVVSAKEFIPWRWWRMKSNIVKVVSILRRPDFGLSSGRVSYGRFLLKHFL